MSWTSLTKASVYVLIFRYKTLSTWSVEVNRVKHVEIIVKELCHKEVSRYRATNLITVTLKNVKQTYQDLSLFCAWSAAMHNSWNIRNFTHDKRVQSLKVSKGFFCTLVIGGSMAEWSARRTPNPAVLGSSPALATCWICSPASRVQILGHACK